jgi:hypothetical protein
MQATPSADTYDIRCLLLECSDCCGVWRAYKPERCIYCAREYGLPYTLDPLRRLALFQAIQSIPVVTTVAIQKAMQELQTALEPI